MLAEWALSIVGVEKGREFRFRGDLYSQESTFPLVNYEFVANLLPSLLVEIFFENRIIVVKVMAKSLVSFFDSRCINIASCVAAV